VRFYRSGDFCVVDLNAGNGASPHPGGGVFAASGHNTAQVVLKDVKGGWF
jgi:hypothetical protein